MLFSTMDVYPQKRPPNGGLLFYNCLDNISDI